MNDDRRLPAAPPLATAGPDPVLDLVAEARKIEAEFSAAAEAALKLEKTDPALAQAHMKTGRLGDAFISAAHKAMGATPRTLPGLGAQLLYTAEYCGIDGSYYLFTVVVEAARLLGCPNEPSPELIKFADEWPL
jgi:hypothetical protein